MSEVPLQAAAWFWDGGDSSLDEEEDGEPSMRVVTPSPYRGTSLIRNRHPP